MLSIAVGPFVMSIGQAMLVVAFVVALVAGKLAARRRGVAIGDTLFNMALVGFVAARVVFVVRYLEVYAATPLDIVDIRDGGFDPRGGLAGVLVYAGVAAWRGPPLRRPLAAGLIAGSLTWGLTGGLLTLIEQQSRLPDVRLSDMTGTPLDRAALVERADGRPIVVNLWATWCPPCREEMPVFETLQNTRGDVLFVFANQGESAEKIADFLDAQDLTLDHVVRDPHGRFAQAVGSVGLPTTLFYDAGGQLVDSHIGQVSRASLLDALDAFEHAEPATRPIQESSP